MFGRGAINGAEINAIEINGGTFVLDIAGAADIVVAPAMALTRRVPLSGVADTLIDVDALLTRRVPLSGATVLAIELTATLLRLPLLAGTSSIAIAAHGQLSHATLRAAFVRFRVSEEPRGIIVPLQFGTPMHPIQVAADQRLIIVPEQFDEVLV